MKEKTVEEGEIYTLGIDELNDVPVPIHVHSQKQTAHVSSEMGKRWAEKPIIVAELDNCKYIVDGHLIVEASRKRGVKTIVARVSTVKSMQEVIELHVRNNMSNPPNPVQLLEAVMYMRGHGADDDEIAACLCMNKLSAGILRLEVNEDALREMASMIKDVSMTYFSVHHTFPMNLLVWAFRQPMERQYEAAVALREIVTDGCRGSEHRFSWPSVIEVRVRQIHNREGEQPTEPEGIPLLVRSEGTRGRPSKEESGGDVVRRAPSAEEMIHVNDNTPTARRKVVFKCPHGSTMYVDGKSRAYHLDDGSEESVMYMRRIDDEEGVYQLSDKTLEFMGAKNGKIYIKECTPSQLSKLAAKMKKGGANVCVLSSKEI